MEGIMDILGKMRAYERYAPLLLRIPLGLVFIRFGIEKFEVPKVMANMVIGSPLGWAVFLDPILMVKLVGVAEMVVGVLLVLGLFTRLVALAGAGLLVAILIIAQVRQDFVLLAVALSLAILGAGPWSIDATLRRR